MVSVSTTAPHNLLNGATFWHVDAGSSLLFVLQFPASDASHDFVKDRKEGYVSEKFTLRAVKLPTQ